MRTFLVFSSEPANEVTTFEGLHCISYSDLEYIFVVSKLDCQFRPKDSFNRTIVESKLGGNLA